MTVNEPAAEPVQERVEVPVVTALVSETLVGLSVHVSPVDGEILSDSATVPVKPFVAETVIVEVPAEPTATLTLVGLAVTVKFGAAVTVNVTVTEWESDPLVPVTVTVKLPVVDPVHDRLEVPDVVVLVKATLVGDKVHVRPAEGETVSDNVTVPVNPLMAFTETAEVPAEPTTTGTVIGLAVTVKSGAAVTL